MTPIQVKKKAAQPGAAVGEIERQKYTRSQQQVHIGREIT
jgi:hypothetical protein